MAGIVNDPHKGGLFTGGGLSATPASSEELVNVAGVTDDTQQGGLFAGNGSNVGALAPATNIADLNDVILNNLSDTDLLAYDAASDTWINFSHQLTTIGSLTDVDDSTKEDGSVLVYQASSSKYETTTRLEQQTIIGGTF